MQLYGGYGFEVCAQLIAFDLKGSSVKSINAFEVIVKTFLSLQETRAEGEVKLMGAQIGGSLYCDKAYLINKAANGKALYADGINVKGNVVLSDTYAVGGVQLWGAQIGGDLDCQNATFISSSAALNIDHSVIKGFVFLRRGFFAEGFVNAEGVTIGAGLNLEGGNFRAATLDLVNTNAGYLLDDEPSWPFSKNLRLDGFVYGRIAEGPTDARSRLRWLALDPSFRPQPYRQLAKVMQEAGNTSGARQVLKEMERQLRRKGDLTQRLSSPVLRWTIGYGYDTQWAIWEILGLSAMGWLLYRRSYRAGHIVPTDKDAYLSFKTDHSLPDDYTRFSPLIYSFENTFPIVKLGQTDRWQPDPLPASAEASFGKPADAESSRMTHSSIQHRISRRSLIFGAKLNRATKSPQFIRRFMWIQILLGWLLATLFVAGIAGIAHKD